MFGLGAMIPDRMRTQKKKGETEERGRKTAASGMKTKWNQRTAGEGSTELGETRGRLLHDKYVELPSFSCLSVSLLLFLTSRFNEHLEHESHGP